MPIYEYRCQDCGTTFERLVRSYGDTSPAECPACHGQNCRKAISLFSATVPGASRASADCAPSGGG